MGKPRWTLAATFAALLAMLPVLASAAESDVYFVAIGSKNYGREHTAEGLAPVNSAKQIATHLQAVGARFGILLISDDQHAISKADMERAIVDLKRRIRADRPANPIVFFYFMGHALGDSYSQALYLAPGNIGTLRRSASQSTTYLLTRSTLSNLDVISSLEMLRKPPAMAFEDSFFPSDLTPDFSSLRDLMRVYTEYKNLTSQDNYNRANGLYPPGPIPPVPFVAMFDNCFDSVDQNLTHSNDGIVAQGGGPLARMVQALEASSRRNMMGDLSKGQSDGFVLYATRPGTSATDYEDPQGGDPDPVGSLARRFLLVLMKHSTTAVTIRELRTALDDPRASTYGAEHAMYPVNAPPPYYVSSTSEPILDNVSVNITQLQEPRGVVETRLGSIRTQVDSLP